ncbi:MAG: shikimate kinase [Candidatus Omnitrophota bacterium]
MFNSKIRAMIDKRNIVLVGFMGAGKTTIARMLADRLKRRLVSTDDAIVQREGRSINEIFSHDGEKYFRELEACVVADLSAKTNLVVDCGGGVVLRKSNLDVLKQNGVVVHLKTSPETVYSRIKNETHRPLLNVPDPLCAIKNLMEQRAMFYAQADWQVLTDGRKADDIVNEIIDIFKRSHDTKSRVA